MEIAIDLSQDVKTTESSVLSLCYDDIIGIDEDYMIVSLDKKWGIIDKNNNTVCEFKSDRIEKHGECIFRVGLYECKQISRKTFIECDTKYRSVLPCGDLAIVRGWSTGIVDKDCNKIIPSIYRVLKLNKDTPTVYELYASTPYNQFIIKIAKNTLKFDKLDQIDIEGTEVSFIGTDVHERGYDYCMQYDLYYRYKQVTYNKYDKLLYLKKYRKFGIVNTWKNNYAGAISLDGRELVPNTVYSDVEAVCYNDIFIVTSGYRIGVYRTGIGETVKTVFDSTVLEPTLGFIYLYRKYNNADDWWILGNDGRAHKEVTKAFKISDTNEEGIYSINIYGREYRVDKNLKRV